MPPKKASESNKAADSEKKKVIAKLEFKKKLIAKYESGVRVFDLAKDLV